MEGMERKNKIVMGELFLKVWYWCVGIVCSFAVLLIVLFTSMELTLKGDFFEKEYTKYNITNAVNMQMEDLLYVTKEMMDYLYDKREDLNIEAIVAGEQREFFNEKEKAHMADVKDLFLKAKIIRRVCILITTASIVFFLYSKKFVYISRAFQIVTGIFLCLTAGLFILISTDFTKYFNLFHELFFTNDLWLLDYRTDLLINIVPEPFFVDTAVKSGLLFAVVIVILFMVSTIQLKVIKRQKQRIEL